MKHIFILGAGGFIGGYLARHFKGNSNYQVHCLSKPDFEFGAFDTYSKYSFDNAVILDCIARINGTPEELARTNTKGLSSFLNYLDQYHHAYSYCYFSTLSTLNKDLRANHPYVTSKAAGEELVRSSCVDHKIIRLSFPFGPGESRNRLISRLTTMALRDEAITIDDISLQLTPVNLLTTNIDQLLNSQDRELNFTPLHPVALKEVLRFLLQVTNSRSNLIVNPASAPAITTHTGESFGIERNSLTGKALIDMVDQLKQDFLA